MSSEHPTNQFGPSLTFIYFMIGFVLGACLSMVVLILIRPVLPTDTFVKYLGLFLPLILGGVFGYRVSQGTKLQLPLSSAILYALGRKS